MPMPSNSRLIRILQDRLESGQMEASDVKLAIMDGLSSEQLDLLGEAMSIAWEEGYEQCEEDEIESSQEQ